MPLARSHSLLPCYGVLAFVAQNQSSYTYTADMLYVLYIHTNSGENGKGPRMFNHLMTRAILDRLPFVPLPRVMGFISMSFFISATPSCLLTARMFNIIGLGYVERKYRSMISLTVLRKYEGH